MSVRSRIVAVVALTMFSLVAVAASAAALTVKDVHKQKTISDAGAVSVQCPAGTHVASGGAAISNGYLTAVRKKKNGWLASALYASPSGDLRVDAYCIDRNFHLVTKQATGNGGAYRECPSGTNLISGGASVPASFGTALNWSAPSESLNGWGVQAGSGSSLAPTTAYVYCTPIRMHLDWHSNSAEDESATAMCRSDELRVSGGGAATTSLAYTRGVPGGWTISSNVIDDYTVYAGCL